MSGIDSLDTASLLARKPAPAPFLDTAPALRTPTSGTNILLQNQNLVGFATTFLVTLILFTGNALRAVFCTDFPACPVEAAGATFLIAGEPEAVSVQLAHAQAVVIVTRIFVSDELENVSFKPSKSS